MNTVCLSRYIFHLIFINHSESFDFEGFRVDIKSNEQGIAHGKDSASAIVNGKDADEHSDYSSTYGQRTAGYSPIHSPAPLYLSSTSNHPASKPYYLNSLSSTIKSSTDPETYPVHHETPYIPIKPKTYQSPHYALAAKSYYPKNVAYIPKYNYPSSYHLSSYPKPKAYEAPSYSSSYKSPTYTTGSSYGSTSYGNNYEPTKEPIDYPIPVHKPTYSAHDYGNNVYDSPVYGTRKTSYVSDLYSKSAEPVLTYAKLSGYSSKKHNEKMKYFNEPYEQSPPTVSSSSSTSGQDTSSSAVPLDTAIDNLSTVEKKREDEEIANDYRTESKNGVISTKPTTGIIGLTSYRNPYSIDTEYKSS